MPKTYVQITQAEMADLLEPQGFRLYHLEGTNELVWGKLVEEGGVQYCLRVFSSINPDGQGRECGKDAIRMQVVWRWRSPNGKDSKICKVGTSKRVNRVSGWSDRLQQRIDGWLGMLGPHCMRCGSPMCVRVVKKANKGSSRFWGCSTYPKCRGTQEMAGE